MSHGAHDLVVAIHPHSTPSAGVGAGIDTGITSPSPYFLPSSEPSAFASASASPSSSHPLLPSFAMNSSSKDESKLLHTIISDASADGSVELVATSTSTSSSAAAVAVAAAVPFQTKDDSNPNPNPNLKRSVEVRVTCEVTKISEIDQTYECQGYVYFRYAEPGAPDKEDMDFKDLPDCPFWNSELLFTNSISNEVTEEGNGAECKQGIVSGYVGYNAVVTEIFDLRYFPFDRQILTLVLQNRGGESGRQVMFKPYRDDQSWYGLLGGLMQNWKMGDPLLGLEQDQSNDEERVVFQMRLERQPAFYICGIVLPLFLIVALAATAFAFPIDALGDRMSVVLTLILTSVAFKYVVAGYLPRVSYLTVLDVYVLFGLVCLVAVAIENTVISLYVDSVESEQLSRVDHYCLGVFAGLWLFVNVLMLFVSSTTHLLYPSWDRVLRNKKAIRAQQNAAYRYTHHGASTTARDRDEANDELQETLPLL